MEYDLLPFILTIKNLIIGGHMKRIALLIACTLIFVTAFAFVEETASFKGFLYGSAPECEYDNWVSHIAEGIASPGYNLYAPYDRQTNGFGDFKVATTAELTAWESALDLFLQGEFEDAETILNDNNIPYQIVIFNDTDTGRQYHVLRENVDLDYYDDNGTPDFYEDDEVGAFNYGWGIYVVNINSNVPVIVNMPHPNDDFITTAVGYKCFEEWNARYFMVTGAGREVRWSNVGSYTNAKSLCDPTRVSLHPFNSAYRRFAQQIRTTYNKREFSAQIHDYDWSLHIGYANLQISVGNQRTNPNLPVRDLSSQKLDLINATNYVVHPQNSIGFHDEVTINDFYAVHYNRYPFTYDHDGEEINVNNRIDLPGFQGNVHEVFTTQGIPDWDVYDPFFHIEMSELPNCYPQDNNNFYWFYGFDADAGHFDYTRLFDNVLLYYSPWIEAMGSVLPQALGLNDNMIPDTPQDLTVIGTSPNYIRLSWTPSDSYDFKGYEILYSTSPIEGDNYQTFNRNNDNELASLLCDEINVTGLLPNETYFFKIRAVDYNDNASPLSAEISGQTGPASLDNVVAYGNGEGIDVKFRAISQNSNQGFKIYRKTESTDYVLLSDYTTNNDLIGTPSSYINYSYVDNTPVTNEIYSYKISSVNYYSQEFDHFYTPRAQRQEEFTLTFHNQANNYTDTVVFSKNLFASDGRDNDFDIVKSTSTSGNYVWAGFFEQSWANNGVYLDKEVHGDFDLNSKFKQWRIRVKSNQTNTPLFVTLSDNFGRYSEKLYLRNLSTNTYTDLTAEDAQFTITDNNYKEFYLIWGNLQPEVTVSNAQNAIYQAGSTAGFYFTNPYNFLVDHYTVYLKNSTDSLLVADNLPANTTVAPFIVPNNITMHNAKIYVQALCTDGQITIAKSNYAIGIVPSEISYQIPAGYSLQSNPFISYNINEDVLGDDFDLASFANGVYTDKTQMNYNTGYALYLPDNVDVIQSKSVGNYPQFQAMQAGWNLMANPHMSDYRIKNLTFTLNNTQYTLADLVQHKVISPAVYVYRDNKYIATDIIYGHEAFFVYTNLNNATSLICNFTPYFDGARDITKTEIAWTAKINIIQQDRDEIVFGVSKVKRDSIDFMLDYPEAPVKNLNNNLSFYFPVDPEENSYSFSRLNRYLYTPFSNTDEETKEWHFAIDVNELSPITLQADLSDLPTGYSVKINLSGQTYVLNANSPEITFTPDEIGTINGILIVGNQFVSSDEHIAKPFTVSAYPNPFNPITNIAFNLATASEIEINIYNIKGQKVTTIINDKLRAGNHVLQWNGKDKNGKACASNIYFAQVKLNGKQSVIKKITLLK